MSRRLLPVAGVLLACLVAGCRGLTGGVPITESPQPSMEMPASQVPSPTGPTAVTAAPLGTVTQSSVADQLPDDLTGITWAVGSSSGLLVGTTGDPSRLTLPAAAHYLGASDDLVVWSLVAEDGTSTMVYGTSRADGSPHWSTKLEGQMAVGVVAGGAAIVTGFAANSRADPGVFRVSLVDGTAQTIIAAADRERVGTVGRNLMVSTSGMTVVSSLCSTGACSGGSVIDPASGLVIRQLQTTDGPSATSDDYVLVRTGGDVTSEIALVRIKEGTEVWRDNSAREYYQGYLTESNDVVVATGGDGFRVSLISLGGRAVTTEPMAVPDAFLWVELSTSTSAVVGSGGPFPGSVGEDGSAIATVLALSGLKTQPDRLVIDLDGSR